VSDVGPRRPTIQDVAKLAGVSTQTVSNVLNERPVTREATRLRVEDAIRQLGYERDSFARALRTRHVDALGLVIEDETRLALHDPVHASLLTGMVERAHQRDYTVTVLVTAPETTERTIARIVRQRRVAGLVVSLQGAEGGRVELAQRLASLQIPTVAFEQRMGPPEIRTVASDNEGGAAKVADHLKQHGHRRIAYLTGAVRWPGGERRYAGLAAAAGPELEISVWRCPAWSVDAARASARTLLSKVDVTAIFCANDLLALGVLLAATDAGLAVPDDLSVVGFDDFAFAPFVSPSLTTVRVDAAEMGQWAADVLMRPADSEAIPDLMLATELIVRDSTGPAPSSRSNPRPARAPSASTER
jgi:DNA-binding LacI/PurR family transcriptional regulator